MAQVTAQSQRTTTCTECGRPAGTLELCRRCYQQHRKHGQRPCSFCGEQIVTSHTPRAFVRAVQHKVTCARCAGVRQAAWSWDHDACLSCGTTSSRHASGGYCNVCDLARRHGTQVCACGAVTNRNFSQSTHRVRCAGCLKRAVRAVFDGYCRNATINSLVVSTTLSASLIAKCFRFIETGDVATLTLNARAIVQAELGALRRQLVNPVTGQPTLAGLVVRLIRGDPSVGEMCLVRIRPLIRQELAGYRHPWETAEDLVQDVMVAVWQALPGWQATGSIWHYLRKVIRNAAKASIRSTRSQRRAVLTNALQGDEGWSEPAAACQASHWDIPELVVLARERRTIDWHQFAPASLMQRALFHDLIEFPSSTQAERAHRLSRQLKRPVTQKTVESTRHRLAETLGSNVDLRARLREAVHDRQ